LQISTNNSLYLENGKRRMHSFYKGEKETACTVLNVETANTFSDPKCLAFLYISEMAEATFLKI